MCLFTVWHFKKKIKKRMQYLITGWKLSMNSMYCIVSLRVRQTQISLLCPKSVTEYFEINIFPFILRQVSLTIGLSLFVDMCL